MKKKGLKLQINLAIYSILFMLYDLLAFNYVFFTEIYQTCNHSWLFTFGTFLCLWALGSVACLLLFWRLSVKPLSYLFLLINAGVFYFVHTYHASIDSEMLENVLQTNCAETLELLNMRWAAYILLLGVVPALLISRLQIVSINWRRRLSIIGSLLCIVLVLIVPNRREIIPFVRTHKPVKYLLVPVNYIGAIISLSKHYYRQSREFVPIGTQSGYTQYWHNGKKNLIIFVVGETARAQNFSFGGYPRNTNAPLQPYIDNLLYYKNTTSCGTSTAVSVPCMFSKDGRTDYESGSAAYVENALDVLQKNGYYVTWIENNSDCKDVCNRVHLRQPCGKTPQEKECLDAVLLNELGLSLPPTPKNTLVVMHTIGSHGPKYYKRYPADMAPYQPVCATERLNECTAEEVINVYDNTIYYTSYILAQLIEKAQKYSEDYNVTLIYVSDHGESLGENGLYLHSAPYVIAPKQQTQVPFIIWASDETLAALGLDKACLRAGTNNAVSHDNIFHILLGLAGISAQEYNASLDFLAACTTAR